MIRRIGLGLLACTALAGSSRTADAAVAVNICIPARMAPAATTIPHNFPGFGYDAPNAQSQNIHLVDTTKGTTEMPVTIGPVSGSWNKIVPQAGFNVGDSYTLTFDSLCYATGGMSLPAQKPITFTISADAPLPTMLGDVMGTPTVVVKNHGTSEATFDATYTLAAEMKPWVSVYELALTLDGKAIETHPTVSTTGDTVQIAARGWCDDAASKTTSHSLALTATMPFATSLTSASTPLTFTCPAAHIVTPTPQQLTPPPSTETTDTTTPSTTTTHSGGCAMSPSNESNGAFLGLGFVVGLAMVVRRVKRGAK